MKTAGTGITRLNAILYNSGTVRIEQGQLAAVLRLCPFRTGRTSRPR